MFDPSLNSVSRIGSEQVAGIQNQVDTQVSNINIPESQGTIARIKSVLKEKIDSIISFANQFRNKVDEFQQIDSSEIKRIDNPFYEEKEQFHELHLDKNTSIIYNTHTEKYTLISEAPPITNLVISGGGAKGAVLPGVIKAMEVPKNQLEEVHTNMLRQDEAIKNMQEFQNHDLHTDSTGVSLRDQLVNVAGSSVGAVTAGLIAAGMSADDISAATSKVDFKALLGEGTGPILKDGKPLQQFIQNGLEQSITKNLIKHFNLPLDKITEEMIGNDDLWKLVNELKEKESMTNDLKAQFNVASLEEITVDKHGYSEDIGKLIKIIQEDSVSVTFSILRSLRELDPKSFKELTVTATCLENGKTFYFDADSTPNLSVATACRASASLPIVLKPITIPRDLFSDSFQKQLPETDPITFVDGGYFDNIPVGIMEGKQNDPNAIGKNKQNLQTLALVFDETKVKEGEQSPFQEVKVKKHALYNPSNLKERFIRDIAAKFFAGINTKERNTLSKEAGLERIREDYTQRSIPLKVDIKTKDFKKAKLHEKEYADKGFKQGIEYLANHEGELVSRKFNSLAELLKYVPETIQKANVTEIETFRKDIVGKM